MLIEEKQDLLKLTSAKLSNQSSVTDHQSTKTTGEKITKTLLRHKNLKGIAKKSGIPYQSLFDMKKRNTYTSEVMDILAVALGITVTELIDENSDISKIRDQFPCFIDKIVNKG